MRMELEKALPKGTKVIITAPWVQDKLAENVNAYLGSPFYSKEGNITTYEVLVNPPLLGWNISPITHLPISKDGFKVLEG